MGKTRKKKAREKLAGRKKGKRKGEGCPRSPQLPPVLFSCLRFLNSADPTISEPGTGYVNMIYQVTNTQRTSWNIKKLRRSHSHSHSHLCPSSLKQMNFKMERFSGLLVTINTEVIIFNIRLSIITKLNHEIQEQWHLAPMLVYDSIHPWACS